MGSVQVPVPVQEPLHPAKKAPLAGTAVNLTLVPEANEAVQVGLQLMAAGLLVTVPLAFPVIVVVSV